MFKKISINRFRSINNISISNLKQVNLFVGKNNCGKTSVLEAMFIITGISNPKIPITLNQFRDIDYLLGDDKDYKLIFNNLNYEDAIKITAEIGRQIRDLEIKPHYQQGKNEVRSTLDEKFFRTPDYNTLSEIKNISGLDYNFKITENKKTKTAKAEIYRKGLLYEQAEPKNYKETVIGTYVNPKSILQLLPERLNNLIVQKKIKGIIKILQKIDKTITGISIGTDKLIYCDTGLSELIPINVMGDGIRRLLSLIVTIANQKNGFVFIDEIENGFHHKTLKILWETIFETVREYNVQIFVTTHSYECIKAFQHSYIYNKYPENEDGISLYRIEKKTKEHKAHSFTNKEIEDLLIDNWEIR